MWFILCTLRKIKIMIREGGERGGKSLGPLFRGNYNAIV